MMIVMTKKQKLQSKFEILYKKLLQNFTDQQFQYNFRFNLTTFENVLLKLQNMSNAITELSGYPETTLEKQ